MKKLSVVLMIVAAGVVAADTIVWNPEGSGAWADDSRWLGGVPPAAGDTVDFNGCTGVVTVADAATLAKVAKITLTGAGSGLVISNDVADGDFEFAKPVSGDGVLIKQGDGITRMTYAETAEKTGYWMSGGLEVLDGTLVLPRTPSKDIWLTKVTVMDPGVFVHTGNAYTRIVGGLWGTGSVSNDLHKPLYLGGGTEQSPAVFSGRFLYKAYPCLSHSEAQHRVQYFTGTDSVNVQNLLVYTKDGTAGILKFGDSSAADKSSSVGGADYTMYYRGPRNRMLYLGEGEVSKRAIQLGTGAQDAIFDAGEHGGLTLNGTISASPTEGNMMNVFTLTGNGENVFAGTYSSVTNPEGRYVAHYLVKDGNGSWRFTADKKRTMIGTVEVKKGELKFDSIAERGTDCALGPANLTQSRYYGSYSTTDPSTRYIDDTKDVPYAMLLGNGLDAPDADHLATLNYTGTTDAEIHTRVIAVNGAGRLKSETAGLVWDGITAAAAGKHTLVTEVADSTLYSLVVTNGPGTMGLVKEGAGLCQLARESDLTGDLAVKQGTLRIPGQGYSWYRLTITETWNGATNSSGTVLGGSGTSVTMRQFALLDENGENQILNLPHNKAADAKPWLLAPGEAAVGCDHYRILGTDDTGRNVTWALSNLFTTVGTNCGLVRRNDANSGDLGYSGFNTPPRHQISIVLRMPESAHPVTHYDIKCQGYWPDNSSAGLRMPRAWTVEGSVDGLTWDNLSTLTTNDNTYANIPTGGNGRWYSNNKTTAGIGYALSATASSSGGAAVHPASVAAAAGARLEMVGGTFAASGVTIDCAAEAGTIRGAVFSDDAKVYLTGFTDEMLGSMLPIDLSGCAGLNGRKWKVVVDGVLRPSYYATVAANGVVVSCHGMRLFFK